MTETLHSSNLQKTAIFVRVFQGPFETSKIRGQKISKKWHKIELWGGITPGKSLIPTFYLARWSGLVNRTKCKKQNQNSSRITKVIFEKPGTHKTKMKVPKRKQQNSKTYITFCPLSLFRYCFLHPKGLHVSKHHAKITGLYTQYFVS